MIDEGLEGGKMFILVFMSLRRKQSILHMLVLMGNVEV